AVETPLSCSFSIPMICSSVNRDRFISVSILRDEFYPNLEEFVGLRSQSVDTLPSIAAQTVSNRQTFAQQMSRGSQARLRTLGT
ncbi:MAG: hypothetical protein AAGI92_07005, partial [Pseudomonadota bacterium]